MKRSLLISVAAMTFACGGGSHQADTNNGAPSASPAPTDASAVRAEPGPVGGTAAPGTSVAAQSNQTVTLIGCLQGSAPLGVTGTSGSRARARATGAQPAAVDGSGGASTDRFMLVDAAAASTGSAGVGANGAGASGGPLVSGKSSFELDGIPPDARMLVNKTVRIVGRLDATIGRNDTSPNAAAGGAPPRSSGAGPDSRGQETATAVNNAAMRHLIVESVELVAQSCGR